MTTQHLPLILMLFKTAANGEQKQKERGRCTTSLELAEDVICILQGACLQGAFYYASF